MVTGNTITFFQLNNDLNYFLHENIFNFGRINTFIHKGSSQDTKINEDRETTGNYFKVEKTYNLK